MGGQQALTGRIRELCDEAPRGFPLPSVCRVETGVSAVSKPVWFEVRSRRRGVKANSICDDARRVSSVGGAGAGLGMREGVAAVVSSTL